MPEHRPPLLARIRALRVAIATRFRQAQLRYMPSEAQHLFALTIVVGLVCGLAAVTFHLAIQLAEHLLIERALKAEWWMLWTVLSPAFFGLLAGVALVYIVPGARGSGIPQVKAAYATGDGRIPFRDALGKFVIGALQIGSGASLGREGPTVQICAGTASLLARATSLPKTSIRKLTPVGVAAGIAAAFNAPIAAVTFTIEEIVGDLDQTVLSGVVVAAALAAVIERSILGANPIIAVQQGYGLEHASSLPFYALLGVAAAGVSVAFTTSLLRLRAWFQGARRLPRWAQPAVGGLVAGALAVIMLRGLGAGGITGGGYQMLGAALAGRVAMGTLAVLCVAKLVATVFSYSSGGAGGIFAPSLFMGGMVGGVVGFVDTSLLHHHGNELGAFALVGMGAVFAGVIRAPITSVLIIFEMTGGYGLVLPLMIANMISYGLSRRWSPVPIYDALLEQDGIHLPRVQDRSHPLDRLVVGDAMSRDVAEISVDANTDAAMGHLTSVAAAFGTFPVKGRAPIRMVSLTRLRQAVAMGEGGKMAVDLSFPVQPIAVDEPLLRATVRMHQSGARQLPVRGPEGSAVIVGIITMHDVVRAHARVAAGTGADASVLAPGPELPESIEIPTSAGSRASGADQLLATRVRTIMISAPPVARATRMLDLMDRLLAAKQGILPVSADDGGDCGLVSLEQVRDIWRDDKLNDVLLAADIARNAPAVLADAEISEALRLMDQGSLDALPVAEGASGAPLLGVITRADIGRYLFGEFVTGMVPSSPRPQRRFES